LQLSCCNDSDALPDRTPVHGFLAGEAAPGKAAFLLRQIFRHPVVLESHPPGIQDPAAPCAPQNGRCSLVIAG